MKIIKAFPSRRQSMFNNCYACDKGQCDKSILTKSVFSLSINPENSENVEIIFLTRVSPYNVYLVTRDAISHTVEPLKLGYPIKDRLKRTRDLQYYLEPFEKPRSNEMHKREGERKREI